MSSIPPTPTTPTTPTPTTSAPTPPPAPQGGRDEIHAVMQKLFDDSRVVKSAHFIASQRKGKHAKRIGVVVIIVNVLIGSGLIEIFVPEQQGQTRTVMTTQTVIKLLAFLAAALAGIQTFFNFQNDVQCHTNAGNTYSSINHRLGLVIAQYSNPGERAAAIEDFKALQQEYLKANEDNKGCIPSDDDYKKSREGVSSRKGVRRT